MASLVLPVLLAPTSVTSPGLDEPDETDSATDCFGDVDLVMCVTGTFTIDLTCQPLDAEHVGCDAPVSWVSEGNSTIGVPGETHRDAQAKLHWCEPDGACHTRLNLWWTYPGIQGCYFGTLQPDLVKPSCSETRAANLDRGPMRLDAGECMDVTLSGSIIVYGYLSVPVVHVAVDDHPLATAEVQVTESAHVCN